MRRLLPLLAIGLLIAGCSSRAADERRERAQLVKRLEAAVTATARREAAAGLFKGPVLRTECGARVGTNPNDLASPGGRYRCFAITFQSNTSSTGQEYLATVDWRRGTFRFFRYKIPLYLGV